MQASTGHPLAEELAAYADAEASAEVETHVRSCLACTERATGYAHTQAELRRSLFRFDCPDAQTLGEYSLDLLGQAARVRVASHTLECLECSADLRLVRSYLAEPTAVPQSIAGRARRVVASLFRPAPGLAYGGLRGSADSATRIFQADDVTLTVGPGQERGSLIGLVVVDALPPETVADREVRLVAPDGAVVRSTLDDLGNFEFDGLKSGSYALEVDLRDSLVVVEELRIG